MQYLSAVMKYNLLLLSKGEIKDNNKISQLHKMYYI